MRKNAAILTVSTLVLGVFGAFFRWLQNAGGFDPESGLPVPGSAINVIALVYCVLAVAVILALSLGWLRRYSCAKDCSALRSRTVLPVALGWLFGLCFAVSSCVVLLFAGFGKYPTLQRLLGAFGILAGLCFPFLPAKPAGSAYAISRTAAAFCTLFFCFWLVFSYRLNANNPVRWAFAPEILALAAAAVAFYYAAAFHFGAGTGSRALVALQLAVFFNTATLFETRTVPMTLMFLAATVMLVTLEYLVLENLREPEQG